MRGGVHRSAYIIGIENRFLCSYYCIWNYDTTVQQCRIGHVTYILDNN